MCRSTPGALEVSERVETVPNTKPLSSSSGAPWAAHGHTDPKADHQPKEAAHELVLVLTVERPSPASHQDAVRKGVISSGRMVAKIAKPPPTIVQTAAVGVKRFQKIPSSSAITSGGVTAAVNNAVA